MNTIRVLLVEEIRLVRELLKGLLNDQPDMHVAGRIPDPKAAVVRARELRPHVALIGTIQSEEARLELIQALRASVPDTRIVVMDFWGADDRNLEWVQAGAHALILKDTATTSLLHAIRLAANEIPAPAPVAEPVTVPRGSDGAMAPLTQREREISVMISRGHSNKEIARELQISLHTVKAHVRGIMGKLALRSRVEIAAYAFQGKSSLTALGLVLAQAAGVPLLDTAVAMLNWVFGFAAPTLALAGPLA